MNTTAKDKWSQSPDFPVHPLHFIDEDHIFWNGGGGKKGNLLLVRLGRAVYRTFHERLGDQILTYFFILKKNSVCVRMFNENRVENHVA